MFFQTQYEKCNGPCGRFIRKADPMGNASSVVNTTVFIDGRIHCAECAKKLMDESGVVAGYAVVVPERSKLL